MSGRTVHQADLSRRLREAFKRIRILEARTATGGGSGGSYVFLDEQVAEADGDPIVFSTITDAYRHLVVELVGATDQALPGDPDDLLVRWGNAAANPSWSTDGFYTEGYEWGAGWFWGATDPPTWNTAGNNCDDVAVPVKTILPAKEINCVGDGDTNPSRASATFRFPYYAAESLMRTVLWQAQGPVQSTAITTNPSSVRNAISTGGGSFSNEMLPIDRLMLYPSVNGWLAGSRASLYGIA